MRTEVSMAAFTLTQVKGSHRATTVRFDRSVTTAFVLALGLTGDHRPLTSGTDSCPVKDRFKMAKNG